RLEDSELAVLYKDYHSEEYQQMRYASEPWYTTNFNAALLSNRYYRIRRDSLAPIVRKLVADRKIERVLDYGGDRGDLVVDLIDGAKTYVYDISGVEAVEGVVATNDPATCKPDLIINSNVLEHVGFPQKMVKEMFEIATQECLIFLEVPLESPFGTKRIVRRLAQIAVTSLTRPALARHVSRLAALYMMHEHINFFTERSLTVLMRSCGGKVISSGTFLLPSPGGEARMAWSLGTKN
ncbi:MAG: methyltransferase domain-containing protein, partial [Terracidiphilus sp.]